VRGECSVGRVALVLGHRHAAVLDVDPLDDQDVVLECDLAASVSHQTGGIDPSGREGAGERARQSTGGGADDVVQRGRVLRELTWCVAVVLGYRAMGAVVHRVGLRG
jgi:hypothetical protein